MNLLKVFFTLFLISGLSGCFMERETIDRGYNVVYSQVDWWYFDQDGGMSNRILPSGKQEFSTGYNTAYYIPTTQQNYPLGNLSVLMKEKVGRNFTINFGFKVVSGADLKLVINYLPQSDAQKVSDSMDGIDKIEVDLQQVFAINVLPFAQQVIMDTIDSQSLYAVNTEQLAKVIDRNLKAMLANIIITERVVDDNGNIVLSGNTLSIVDVIDINNINIVPGEMPDVVKTEVEELTTLQAQLKAVTEDLSIETDIKSQELLDAARNIKAQNDPLVELLKNPMFVRYQKFQQLKAIVEKKYDADGKAIVNESKTQIFFYQKGMTAEDAANLVRSSQ